MLSNDDMAPPSATDDMDEAWDEEAAAWEHVRKMGCCFDLLAIATSDATATTSESERSERHNALQHIHTWAVKKGQMEIQKFDGIKKQYEVLCARLRTASTSTRHQQNWANAKSSLVVIKAIWHSDRELGAGCMDLLYLLEHCVLKTSCEAIVESFCSIIGRHGSAGRHPEQGVYTKEAVVAANGPAMGHADDFLSATNNRIFASNKNTGWHFVTKLFGAIRLVSGHSSNTLDNLARNEKTRLPFMTGFWRQQQKPAPMSGLIFTPEWLRDSKLRWTDIREKKRAKRAAILQSELDGGDVSMGDGEEEGKQKQEEQQEEQEEEQEEEEERKSCRTTTGWWISS